MSHVKDTEGAISSPRSPDSPAKLGLQEPPSDNLGDGHGRRFNLSTHQSEDVNHGSDATPQNPAPKQPDIVNAFRERDGNKSGSATQTHVFSVDHQDQPDHGLCKHAVGAVPHDPGYTMDRFLNENHQMYLAIGNLAEFLDSFDSFLQPSQREGEPNNHTSRRNSTGEILQQVGAWTNDVDEESSVDEGFDAAVEKA